MPGGNPSRKPSEITWTNFDIQARVSFAQNWSEKTQLLLPWQETCVTVGEGRRLKLAFFFVLGPELLADKEYSEAGRRYLLRF